MTKEKLFEALDFLKENPDKWYQGDYCSKYWPEKKCLLGTYADLNGIKQKDYPNVFCWKDAVDKFINQSFINLEQDNIAEINDDSASLEDLEEELKEYFEDDYHKPAGI